MSSSQILRPRMLEYLSQCQDPRKHRIRHSLTDIIVIVILGTLCGEEGWEELFEWAVDKQEYLETFLSLKHGIPCPDTLRRVMERLDPDSFFCAFSAWAKELQARTAGQICIDGKVLKRAEDENGYPLQLVSAWSQTNRVVLGVEIAGPKKRGEIPAIEELLDTLVFLPGDIVTTDAIGCQKTIMQKIESAGAGYVIALKKNQPTLYAETDNFFIQAMEAPEYAPCKVHSYESQCHGRTEKHEVWVSTELDWLEFKEEWAGLRCLVMINRQWVSEGKEHSERRYYVSNLSSDPKDLGTLIRNHWSIENEYHWHLDVTLGEDESRISGKANRNLRIARDISLKLLKSEPTSKKGLRSKRGRCHRSDKYLTQVLMSGKF